MAEQTKILIDTAIYLNNQIKLGQVNNSIFNKQISQNSDSINTNRVVLQDIKDAINTKNREFLEREEDISVNGLKKSISLQDWSISILYIGYGLFSLLLLIYIFTYTQNINIFQNAFVYGILYLVLTLILYTCTMFLIQRYG
jgi:hypothetical protein